MVRRIKVAWMKIDSHYFRNIQHNVLVLYIIVDRYIYYWKKGMCEVYILTQITLDYRCGNVHFSVH